MLAYFVVSFVVCLGVSSAIMLAADRKQHVAATASWLGVVVFSLLVAAALSLLNIGR